MDDITITPEDIKEIEETQSALFRNSNRISEFDGRLKQVFDLVNSRKFTTYEIVNNKIRINKRSARSLLEALRERGLVGKQYMYLKCSDGCKRKTALYYRIKEENERKKKR